MSIFKKTVGTLALGLMVFTLSACSDGSDPNPSVTSNSPTSETAVDNSESINFADASDDVSEIKMKLSDGRAVVCLKFSESGFYKGMGGLSCDWANAR